MINGNKPVLRHPDTNTSVLKGQVDQMVYKLYDLTPEEIAIEDKLKWLEQISEFTSMVLSGREKELREKLRVCEIYIDGNK